MFCVHAYKMQVIWNFEQTKSSGFAVAFDTHNKDGDNIHIYIQDDHLKPAIMGNS